jgi:choice-of-anchor C domain-containing protein
MGEEVGMRLHVRPSAAAFFGVCALALSGCVINGGFETPRETGYVVHTAGDRAIAGWNIDSGSVDVVASDVWQPSQGRQSLDLTGSTEAGRIRQVLIVTPGASYNVEFDLAGNPDGAPAIKELNVYWDGAQVGSTLTFDTTGHSRTDMGWEHVSLPVTATGDTATLEFESLTAPFYGPVIDNVRVVEAAT